MAKLTRPQWRELNEIAGRDHRSHYVDDYAPIKRLLELGYVERKPGKFGGSTYAITPAGRAQLHEGGEDRR